MAVLYLMVPIALVLAGAGVWAFLWSVRSGQYDDVETPAIRVLLDNEPDPVRRNETEDAAPSSPAST